MQNIKDKIKIGHIKSIATKDKLAISDKLIDLFRMFNISTLCLKNKMIKFKGYPVSDIISVLTLFPFMALATVNSFMLSRFKQLIDAQKDTFFRLNKRFSKPRSKDAAGYKRAQEMFVDKISNAIALIKRAVKHGFVPDYVLCDSWFSSEKLIKTVRQLKKGIIHFLGMVKMDKRLYDYQGQQLNAKQLKKKLKPTHKKRAKKLNAYYIEIIVNYSDIGPVKLFLTRFCKRSKWRLILSTDLNLSFQQAMKIYNIRWTIEMLFKDCKQHLNLGKCQSNDFDAQIADTTISLLVYMMLSFHKKIHSYTTLGALFAQYRDEFIEATVAEKLWQLFISLQLTISEILEIDCTKMMRVIFQLPEIDNMFKSLSKIFFEDNCSIEFKKAA